ncbi:hypothetical protein EDD90_4863 [Streptomyces sp. Ag109_O5-1]|nr:hypothetical protein EDD90_4863 [Streptomyces sp. Ag109_O5-1]
MTKQMQAARMRGYKELLRIEEVPVPDPGPDEILPKVAAAGMCRSDYQLLNGYVEVMRGPLRLPGREGRRTRGSAR